MSNNHEELLCKGFTDSTGRQYYIGDVVLNMFFGDLWTVSKATEPNPECPYMLNLWGDPEYHQIDLDEPEDFAIVKHPWDEGYDQLMKEIKETRQKIDDM